jgi:hypothetical protein
MNFKRQFDETVDQGIAHHAKKRGVSRDDIKFLIRLNEGNADGEKMYQAAFKLLVQMRPVQDLRLLEDIMLKWFDTFNREAIFIMHITRMMLKIAEEEGIEPAHCYLIVSTKPEEARNAEGEPIIDRRTKAPRIIQGAEVALYKGGAFIKWITASEIFSMEQISETVMAAEQR